MDVLTGIGVFLIGVLGGWIIRPYFVKRSEEQAKYDAILGNLDTVRIKVETTERAAATIKEDIAHAKWWDREDRVLRRNKLEELLTTALECNQIAMRWNLRAKSVEEYAALGPWYRVYVLARLFFPTLYVTANELTRAGLNLTVAAINLYTYDKEHHGKPSYAEGRKSVQAEYSTAVDRVRDLVSKLEIQARDAMETILAKPEE
jgi:hypothetical protein